MPRLSTRHIRPTPLFSRIPVRPCTMLVLLSLLPALVASGGAAAAEFIGVAAALRGDVIRVATADGGGDEGQASLGEPQHQGHTGRRDHR